MKDRGEESVEMKTEPSKSSNEGEKELLKSKNYYAVGRNVQTTEGSMLASYPKPKKEIAREDIIQAIQGTVKIFDTRKEAENYARLIHVPKMSSKHSYAATIFEVQPKNDLSAPIQVESVRNKNPLPVYHGEDQQVMSYAVVSTHDLNFSSCQVYGYPIIPLSTQKPDEDRGCTIM
ncbi:hypothetical protein ACQUW5_06390 [Legionella sp. CNM-1927-20]|uniref:hypothetical protein n=1 Tax=Legionella sp. CNM-1927-20 TaxID=3422221 RepID=UPI00403AF1DA